MTTCQNFLNVAQDSADSLNESSCKTTIQGTESVQTVSRNAGLGAQQKKKTDLAITELSSKFADCGLTT